MDLQNKVRENRARRVAQRQALRLEKSRRRDARALDFGLYNLIDLREQKIICHLAPLDQIERILDAPNKILNGEVA